VDLEKARNDFKILGPNGGRAEALIEALEAALAAAREEVARLENELTIANQSTLQAEAERDDARIERDRFNIECQRLRGLLTELGGTAK